MAQTLVQWVVDTRPLWLEATVTKQLTQVAARALALLPADETEEVLRYYHVRDAKHALLSRLLKRYFITKHLPSVSWSAATCTRDARTKPIFIAPTSSSSPRVIFNVSHQDGLVSLIGAVDPPLGLDVGTDIVCPRERRTRDLGILRTDGWSGFVDMHADVFGTAETAVLKRMNGGGTADSKLAYFYTLWCLREAYVKMTGEALVAEWLSELEMRGFAPPSAGRRQELEIWFKGAKVTDVEIVIRDFLDGYMICSAVKEGEGGEVLKVGEYTLLDIDEVLDFAEASKNSEN